MIETDICILGAGPGGATAALFLAKAGIPCVLVDKATFPRDKVCGDALSGKVVSVLKKLDPDLYKRLAGSPIRVNSWGIKFVAPNLNSLRIPFKANFDTNSDPVGMIAKRMDFDSFLIDEVRKTKLIRLIEGVEISTFNRVGEGWLLTSKDGNVQINSKLVIAGDGAQSQFLRKVVGSAIDPKSHCGGLRAYYKGVTGMDPDNFIELIFLKKFLPGYLWIFPLPGGAANVGVAMRTDMISKGKINLKERMNLAITTDPELKQRFKNAVLQGPVRGFGLPLGTRKQKVSGAGYMLIGDAASFIDPFSGEGIGNAMKSGMVAAEVASDCIKQQDFSSKKLESYDQIIYSKIWGELHLSHRMQKFAAYPWLFNFVVNKAGSNEALRETIISMFDDLDIRKRLKQPSFYMKLLFSGTKKIKK